MINDSVTQQARAIIKTINSGLEESRAERHALQAKRYIASLYERGLIDRTQFENLICEAELALSEWKMRYSL